MRRRSTRLVSPPVDALRQIGGWPAEHKAAGVATVERVLSTAGEADHVFSWASVSKLLVGYATLVAAEEGTLSLDDPAGPEGSTFRHLLAHASGLGPDGELLSAPGRTRIYSNNGINVLARELGASAEMAFSDYLVEAVLLPLDLGAELHGYPAGGVIGSLNDLLRFGRELLSPTLVARETLDRATSVQFPGLKGVLPGYGRQDPNDWGIGFELKSAKSPHWTAAATHRARSAILARNPARPPSSGWTVRRSSRAPRSQTSISETGRGKRGQCSPTRCSRRRISRRPAWASL